MHELKTTDLDHVSGGLAATPVPSQPELGASLSSPPDADASLPTKPPYRGGPVHRPHD